MNIAIKRVYEPPRSNDGLRVLVDRLWPRGLSKDAAQIDIWAKELAPSHELRRWFHSDEGNWAGFKTRYRKELSARRPDAEASARKSDAAKPPSSTPPKPRHTTTPSSSRPTSLGQSKSRRPHRHQNRSTST
ncbi:MAG: DUF488 family protein [Myxococcales bacterium]|nr:DUF488 family protein [Deltaproteobacteria bacterium]NNL23852.1 DUF488 family protein [Myxococcales bacterium]